MKRFSSFDVLSTKIFIEEMVLKGKEGGALMMVWIL
jgi:hypothetical protein